jgi:hypothetical protein
MGEIDQGDPQEQPSHIGPGVTEVHLPGRGSWAFAQWLSLHAPPALRDAGLRFVRKAGLDGVKLDSCATFSAGHLALLLQ